MKKVSAKTTNKKDIYEVRDAYRKALLEVGWSPDSPIEEVGDTVYDTVDIKKPCWCLIMKVKSFYAKLSQFDKELFYNEYLLRSPSYNFWYSINQNRQFHAKAKRKLEQRFYESF